MKTMLCALFLFSSLTAMETIPKKHALICIGFIYKEQEGQIPELTTLHNIPIQLRHDHQSPLFTYVYTNKPRQLQELFKSRHIKLFKKCS